MIDPISAIGIAAATAQFIALGIKVAERLAEYNLGDPLDTPRSLQNINVQLPLLIKALERISNESAVEKLDTDTRCILRGTINGCSNLIKEIDYIAGKVRPTPGEGFSLRLRKVLSSLKNDTRIVEIDRGLQAYIQVLILHKVVDNQEVTLAPPEEVSYFEVYEKLAENFVDRDEMIAKIDKAFYSTVRSQTEQPNYVILQGGKGVGKSQLALEYCHKAYNAGFFKTVFWLEASTPETLKLSLESVASIVRRNREGVRAEKIDFIGKFLTERWHPWLLVLDNYEHKAFFDEPVNRILPQNGIGAILIATQYEAPLGPVMKVNKFLSYDEQEHMLHLVTGAVERNEIEKVKSAVADGFNINQKGSNGFPFLHRAAILNHESLLKFLLEAGADHNLDKSMVSPLAWAANNGSVPMMTALLDQEDKTGILLTQDDYQRVVREAVDKGHAEALKLLLSRRDIKLNMQDDYMARALNSAASKGRLEFFKLLQETSSLPQLEEYQADVLRDAVKEGQIDLVKFLVSQAGFSPNALCEYGQPALYYAVSDIREDDICEKMTRLLLSLGADPNVRGNDGGSALIEASLREKIPIIKLLLEQGADPLAEPNNGFTALISAAKYKSPKAFPILVAADSADTARRADVFTKALNYAARTDNRDLALAVLGAKDGADINSTSDQQESNTPLLLAIKNKSVPVARFLIRKGAKQTITNKDGEMPLLLAASRGLDLVVKELVKAKDSPGTEIQDKEENTPLLLAVRGGHDKVVRVLLEAGADKDAMNQFAETAMDIAEEKRLKKVIDALEGRPEKDES